MGAPNRLTIDTVAHVGRSAALLRVTDGMYAIAADGQAY